MTEIERMQKNLTTLRKSLGWTTKELGERLGLSRQTIAAFEHGEYSITKLHYLAISKLVWDEIKKNPDECVMAHVLIYWYIEDPGWFDSKEEYDEIKWYIETLADACVKNDNLKRVANESFVNFMKEKDHYDFIKWEGL